MGHNGFSERIKNNMFGRRTTKLVIGIVKTIFLNQNFYIIIRHKRASHTHISLLMLKRNLLNLECQH